VIRESLLNQDGKTETITTPSLQAQVSLISSCYQKVGLDPRETQYFEAHGTGTQAGDVVEAQAIASIFEANLNPLLIGSIKTNIGHTEAASGLASIIKTAVALEKGIIPATINFEKANPQLSQGDTDLAGSHDSPGIYQQLRIRGYQCPHHHGERGSLDARKT
jgi:acyl transferase domain-containing protein